MAQHYDAIVIGAGHNGLTCACYLARAGLKVLVLEQYHAIGGMTITEEVTLPGFWSDVHASGYLSAKLSPAVDELELTQHGVDLITPEPNWAHVFPDGRSVMLSRDIERTARGIERYSKNDAQTVRALVDKYQAAKPKIVAGLNSPPPSLSTQVTALERMPGGMDEYRFGLQTMRSWCNETFEAEETKAVCGTFALHAAASPDDAGGAETAWLFFGVVQDVGMSVVKGGMHHVSLALARDLEAHGGQIRTSAKVAKVLVQDGNAVAIRLEDGEEIGVGELVASSVDPQHLALQLLGHEPLGAEIVRKMEQYEWGDSFFTIYAALDDLPEYRVGPDARRAGYVHAITPALDALSRIFTECRAGLLPAEPMVGLINESVVDPTRAPAGKHLMKFVVHYVPYEIRGDATGKITGTTWDDVKEQYADHIIDLLTTNYIPNLKARLIKRVVQSPVDLERRITSAVRGTHQHGAPVPYQRGAMRPIPELGEYRTPISNVYLCGAGSHPGSGVSLMPGRNAARVIAADLKLDVGARLPIALGS